MTQRDVPNDPGTGERGKSVCQFVLRDKFLRVVNGLNSVHGLITAVATVLLVLVTGGLVYVANITDDTLKTEQRAWIAPRGAAIIGSVQRGETIEFEVTYENTGKQPAFNVANPRTFGTMEVPLDSRGTAYWEKMTLPENRFCDFAKKLPKNMRITPSRTAFPGQRYGDVGYIFTDGEGTPQRFLDRKITFWIQGCVIYRTIGGPTGSPYCLYLHPMKDVPPEKWPFRFCGSGNDAEFPGH